MKTKVICVMGRSGTGKTTLVERFVNENKDYVAVQSYTSRPIRDGEKVKRDNGEVCGHEFCFIDNPIEPLNDPLAQEFRFEDGTVRRLTKDEMVAHAYFDGNHYYSLMSQFDQEFYSDEPIKGILYVVDQEGLDDMYESMADRDLSVVVLTASKEVVEARMLERYDDINEDAIKAVLKRVQNDEKKFAVLDADVVIDTDFDVETCYENFSKVIKNLDNK